MHNPYHLFLRVNSKKEIDEVRYCASLIASIFKDKEYQDDFIQIGAKYTLTEYRNECIVKFEINCLDEKIPKNPLINQSFMRETFPVEVVFSKLDETKHTSSKSYWKNTIVSISKDSSDIEIKKRFVNFIRKIFVLCYRGMATEALVFSALENYKNHTEDLFGGIFLKETFLPTKQQDFTEGIDVQILYVNENEHKVFLFGIKSSRKGIIKYLEQKKHQTPQIAVPMVNTRIFTNDIYFLICKGITEMIRKFEQGEKAFLLITHKKPNIVYIT